MVESQLTNQQAQVIIDRQNERVDSEIMVSDISNDEIVKVVRTCSTSAQWSVLDKILKKVNLKMQKSLAPRQLGEFLEKLPADQLKNIGIWVHSFGKDFAPIILVNPGYARTIEANGPNAKCSCKANQGGKDEYYTSTSYSSGRHYTTNSVHIATCGQWTPPHTGHLFSWRRGY